MGRRGLALGLTVLVLAGCTRVVDDARPQRERPVGPIAAGQVDDLVSKNAQSGDAGSSLYATVKPDDCASVAQEVRAPFIFGARPVAHTGGFWSDDQAQPPAGIVEIVGVYHSDFDSEAAVKDVERTIESCRRDTVSAAGIEDDDPSHFRVTPRSDSGSPQIALWSLTDVDWACDNAYVAAHNAAVEITGCRETNGFDVLALARDALKRIEALANATV